MKNQACRQTNNKGLFILIFITSILFSCGGGGDSFWGDSSDSTQSTPASSDFTITTVTGSTNDVGEFSSIAVDSGNNIHISYYNDSNTALNYAYYNGTSWQINNLDSSGVVGEYTTIEVDSSDDLHISYYDYTNTSLKYATNSGVTPGSGNCADSDWNCETIDSPGDVGEFSSIAVDSGGDVHISYYDYTNKNLKYATNSGVIPGSGNCSDTDWNCETVDSSGDVGEFSSIAVDSGGDVHISYYDYTNTNLKYATNSGVTPGSGNCSDTDWDCENVDGTGDVGEYTSIAADSGDNLHISYYDGHNGDLKYTTGTYGSWSAPEVLDSTSNVGNNSSLDLDSGDNVHIVHYDWDNENLKYTTNASGSWVTSTADNSGDVGLDCAIYIDSSDNVHISYYDYDNTSLKYAVK